VRGALPLVLEGGADLGDALLIRVKWLVQITLFGQSAAHL
jgi:hypothetical protein